MRFIPSAIFLVALLAPSAFVLAYPTGAGTCTGDNVGGPHSLIEGTNTASSVVATAVSGGIQVTLVGIEGSGSFNGFVINADSGTVKATGTFTSQACTINTSNSALTHTESSAKSNLAFMWTGTASSVVFNVIMMDSGLEGHHYQVTASGKSANGVTSPSTMATPAASPSSNSNPGTTGASTTHSSSETTKISLLAAVSLAVAPLMALIWNSGAF